MTQPTADLALINRFFDAYNAVDVPTLKSLIADDIHWEHHNRFQGSGSAGLIESILEWAGKIPGRYFEPPQRWAQNGDVTMVEHQWIATPAEDIPGWGWKKGEYVKYDSVSLFVIRDGKIVEWSDYG